MQWREVQPYGTLLWMCCHSSKFYDWMESKGKVGGQNKFPRVMKNAQLEEWIKFIS